MRLHEQMSQPVQLNYFQHLAERPNVQQEMNSLWDAQPSPQTLEPQTSGPHFQQPWMNPMMATPFYMRP